MSSLTNRTSSTSAVHRRIAVLDSALSTFARFGYRKTSMEEVARAAHISRPGLYFLFASKEDLFRAAVLQALEVDIASVDRVLRQSDRAIRDRLLEAFDHWSGRYIGPMTGDVSVIIEDNPELLGDIVEFFPQRFSALITNALVDEATTSSPQRSAELAQTLISTAIGIKYQVDRRDEYLERLAVAIDLLLRP